MGRDNKLERREQSPAVRRANKAFKDAAPKQTMNDYALEQKSFHENRERLKAERIARESKKKG